MIKNFFGLAGQDEVNDVASTARFARNLSMAMLSDTNTTDLPAEFKCYTAKPDAQPRSRQFLLEPGVRVCLHPDIGGAAIEALYEPVSDRPQGPCLNLGDLTVCMEEANAPVDPLLAGLVGVERDLVSRKLSDLTERVSALEAS